MQYNEIKFYKDGISEDIDDRPAKSCALFGSRISTKREERLDDIDEKLENGGCSALVITFLIQTARKGLTVSSRYGYTERLLEMIDALDFEIERCLKNGFTEFEAIQALIYTALSRHETLTKVDEYYSGQAITAMEVISKSFESKQCRHPECSKSQGYVAGMNQEYDPNVR